MAGVADGEQVPSPRRGRGANASSGCPAIGEAVGLTTEELATARDLLRQLAIATRAMATACARGPDPARVHNCWARKPLWLRWARRRISPGACTSRRLASDCVGLRKRRDRGEGNLRGTVRATIHSRMY